MVNRVFFRKNDYQWVEGISYEKWIVFFESIRLSFHVDERILHQLIQSLKILAFQVAQLSLEKEVFHYIPVEEQEKNPFIQQNYLIHDLEELLNNEGDEAEMLAISSSLVSIVQQCYTCIDYIRKNHSSRGTSLHQTYTLILLENKLDRITILVDILDADHYFDTGKFVSFFKMLVRNENRKNSIREFLSQCLGYLAYQIAEHKGSKGNKYITSTPAEYRSMFGSAMKGGVVICFVAIVKIC